MDLHLYSPLYLHGKYGRILLLPFTPKLAEKRNRNRQKISPRIAVIWPKSELKHHSLLQHLSALWIHDVTITFTCSVCMMMTPAITILISNWLVSSCLNATKCLLFSIFWTGQTHLTRPAIDHVQSAGAALYITRPVPVLIAWNVPRVQNVYFTAAA